MSALIYQLFSSSALVSLGLYHLVSTTRNFLKSPRDYAAKPFHPLFNRLHLLPLYLSIAALCVAVLHQFIISFYPDPLLQGHTPVHRFTSLQSAAVLFLFLLLALFLLLSECTSLFPLLPNDLVFSLASGVFYLHSAASSAHAAALTAGLEAKLDSLSSRISLLSSALCLLLALLPRLFVADVGLASSLLLQGLWALQTGLSLYVEAFIPEGCHRLLDVGDGVEGSTKCELDESKLRAMAVLDLSFAVHVMLVMILVFIVYGIVSKTVGVSRRYGSYEALPTTGDANHVQMKTLSGTQE